MFSLIFAMLKLKIDCLGFRKEALFISPTDLNTSIFAFFKRMLSCRFLSLQLMLFRVILHQQ